jgi:hypothetical protein
VVVISEKCQIFCGVSAKPPGVWKGAIDFGDGTPKQRLEVNGEEPIALEHRYQKPGKYFIWARPRDDRDRLVAMGPITEVVDAE